MVCPDKPYVSLENPDSREFAQSDPRRFLQQFASGGGIIDEIQRVPALLSWLQGWADERKIMGDVVITGSAQLDLLSGITQSLAGRVGRVELLPLSLKELQSANIAPPTIDSLMWAGGYPALYDTVRQLTPTQWHSNYLATYVVVPEKLRLSEVSSSSKRPLSAKRTQSLIPTDPPLSAKKPQLHQNLAQIVCSCAKQRIDRIAASALEEIARHP
jgi:hypothetical protein